MMNDTKLKNNKNSSNNCFEIIYILSTMAATVSINLTFFGILYVKRLSLLNTIDTFVSNIPVTFTQYGAAIIRAAVMLLIVFGGAFLISVITTRIFDKIGDRFFGGEDWRTPVLYVYEAKKKAQKSYSQKGDD